MCIERDFVQPKSPSHGLGPHCGRYCINTVPDNLELKLSTYRRDAQQTMTAQIPHIQLNIFSGETTVRNKRLFQDLCSFSVWPLDQDILTRVPNTMWTCPRGNPILFHIRTNSHHIVITFRSEPVCMFNRETSVSWNQNKNPQKAQEFATPIWRIVLQLNIALTHFGMTQHIRKALCCSNSYLR